MKEALKIFAFTVAITMFYWYVGQQVPQKEVHPEKKIEITDDMSQEEMVTIGETLFKSQRGQCATCHTLEGKTEGLRFPDLAGIGARAASRIAGYSDVQYLAESLYDPNAYIVEGFNPGMPAQSRLTDKEILTLIAYLQSEGGTPTVDMKTKFKWQRADGGEGGGGSAEAPAAAASPTVGMDGPQMFAHFGCMACHNVDNPAPILGPSLYDAGKRLSRAELYESIIDPDASIAKGFEAMAGVMGATTSSFDFSKRELQSLVDYLESLKGN